MNYTKLISKKKQYKYSVNICFDLRSEERLADFIPNVTTTEIIREYLGGIIRGNADTHARILYGSYGTGKSHLLTVMSAVLGHINTAGKGFKSFAQLISNYDKELASDIKKFVKEDKPYLVVPVYSDYDDFSKCITFSLKRELERNGIEASFKGYYDEALTLVDKWLEGDESSARLAEECAKLEIEVKDLRKGLSTYEASYEKLFNTVYSGMSYGAAFNSTAGNLIDNMNVANQAEELVKALEEPENYTLFICNWNAEETEYIEALEDIFKDYLPKGDPLNRLEELFKAINTHYASISKSARTTEVYVSDIAKEYRNILSISYKDYNGFFFNVLPGLNGNLQELVVQIRNIKEELETVSDKQYTRVLRVVKQVFDLDETDNLIAAVQDLYKESWESKSHKAFDYTTNSVLDLVSKAGSMDEVSFVYDLAKAVTGFELNYWADNKINDFEEVLRDTVNRLNEYDPEEGLQEGEMKITIESGDGNPVISQFSQDELSPTGQTMLNKMKNTLNNFGGSISYEEKIAIMAQILKEIIN